MSLLILKPVVTEKATRLTDRSNQYSFFVNPKANKIELKNEVKKLYGVDVLSVKTMVCPSEVKSKFTKKGLQVSKAKRQKKAVFVLAPDQSIDIFG